MVGADGIVVGAYALLYFMARHRGLQERLREEDGDFAQAFMAEAQRFVVQIGQGLTHTMARDVVLGGGYRIPKGVRG